MPVTIYQNRVEVRTPPPAALTGWAPVIPDVRAPRRFPSALQLVTGDQWVGNVPTAATPQGWPTLFPDRFRTKVKPALVQYDLPVLAAYTTVVAPEGWRPVWTERFAKPFPARAQMVQPDTWIGSVPTQFVGNAWLVAWDGPQRKPFPAKLQQFDLPVLGAYTTVIVTYPEGWQVPWPHRFAKAFRSVDQVVVPFAPIAIYTVSIDTSEMEIIRYVLYQDHVEALSPSATVQGAPTATWDALLPPRRARPAGDLLWPLAQLAVATPGNTDLWDSIGYAFRRIRPPPPDFARVLAYSTAAGVRIASQPNLLGVSTNPSLLGVSANATLKGQV